MCLCVMAEEHVSHLHTADIYILHTRIQSHTQCMTDRQSTLFYNNFFNFISDVIHCLILFYLFEYSVVSKTFQRISNNHKYYRF